MLDFQILRGYDIAGEHRCLSKVFYPIKIYPRKLKFYSSFQIPEEMKIDSNSYSNVKIGKFNYLTVFGQLLIIS